MCRGNFSSLVSRPYNESREKRQAALLRLNLEDHPVLTGSASRASAMRKGAHGLIGVAGWVALLWLCYAQVTPTVPSE